MNYQLIYGLGLLFLIFVVVVVIQSLIKSKKSYKSPYMMRREKFYDNYRLSQAQAEKDVNCEYKGFITNPV